MRLDKIWNGTPVRIAAGYPGQNLGDGGNVRIEDAHGRTRLVPASEVSRNRSGPIEMVGPGGIIVGMVIKVAHMEHNLAVGAVVHSIAGATVSDGVRSWLVEEPVVVAGHFNPEK